MDQHCRKTRIHQIYPEPKPPVSGPSPSTLNVSRHAMLSGGAAICITADDAPQAYLLFTMSRNPHALFASGNCCLLQAWIPPRGRSSIEKTGAHRTKIWWSQTGSNRRPEACKATALPAELWPQSGTASSSQNSPQSRDVVGLGRFELPTSRLSSARSNQLSYRPEAPASM